MKADNTRRMGIHTKTGNPRFKRRQWSTIFLNLLNSVRIWFVDLYIAKSKLARHEKPLRLRRLKAAALNLKPAHLEQERIILKKSSSFHIKFCRAIKYHFCSFWLSGVVPFWARRDVIVVKIICPNEQFPGKAVSHPFKFLNHRLLMWGYIRKYHIWEYT